MPNLFNTLKTVFIGALLFTSGAYAARDLCQVNGTSHICEGNLGIPRHRMPQVEGEVFGRFLNAVSTEGIFVEQRQIDPMHLYPIQEEMNAEIIDDMARRLTYDPCQTEPILVHHNGTHYQVVDGHHRWAACRLKAERIGQGVKQLAVIVYNVGGGILERLRNFPGVFKIGFDKI